MVNPENLDIHKVLGPRDLADAYRSAGLTDVRAGYFGSWNLMVTNFGEHRRLTLVVQVLDELIKSVLRLARFRAESRLISPYVVAIGRRAAGP